MPSEGALTVRIGQIERSAIERRLRLLHQRMRSHRDVGLAAELRERRGDLLLRRRHALLRLAAGEQRPVHLRLRGDAAREEARGAPVLALRVIEGALCGAQRCEPLLIIRLQRLDLQPSTLQAGARCLDGNAERPVIQMKQQLPTPHLLVVVHVDLADSA